MIYDVAKIREEILRGCAAGETVLVPRETFWHVRWPGEAPVSEQLGQFLAELRAAHCITHGIGYEGYEFAKVKGAR